MAVAPAEEDSAKCFYDRGNNTPRAAEAEHRMRWHLERHHESPWLPLYLGHLLLREPERAEPLYRQAAAACARSRIPQCEVLARANLQRILDDQGQVEAAGWQAEEAERVAISSRDPGLVARSRMVRARHLYLLGKDLERAYLLLRQAEDFAFPDGPYALRRDTLVWLGNVSLELSRPQEAQGFFQKLADLTAGQGDTYAEASARYHLARAFVDGSSEAPRPGDKEKATTLAIQALAKADEAQNDTIQAKSHWLLSLLLSGSATRRHLDTCLKVANLVRDRSYCLNALARHLAERDPRRAREATQEALDLARQAKDSWGMAYAWRERMRASWVSGPHDSALADSRAALDAIETLRDLQEGASSRAGLFASWSDDYSWFAGRLLESWTSGVTPDLDAAFEVIERKRARSLLDALTAARAAPARPAGRSAPAFASLVQVRASLAADEALLSFLIAPDRDVFGSFAGGSWVVVSTRSGSRAFRLGRDRVALRPAVALFNGLFARRDGSEAGPAAGLYRDLLAAPLASLPAGIHRLVILPDDALHQLPFAALRSSPEDPPLAARYEISSAPSATLWRHWRHQRHAPARVPLLALADPVATDTGPAPRLAAVDRAAFPGGPVRLGSLPFARREGRAAVRRLGGASRLEVGDAASEGLVKAVDLRRFSILHFATHTVLDEQAPERSGVLLTSAPSGEDGLLQIREIVSLPLEGRIVVLSSCRSASGAVLRGEGVMGIARAFFQGGAHTVVASLWPLRDDDGADLFERFYLHLAQGRSVSAALREAQRDRIADGAPGYAWAGLVVLGDGDLVPLPGGRSEIPLPGPLGWTAGGTLLVGGLLTAAWLRNRHRNTKISSKS